MSSCRPRRHSVVTLRLTVTPDDMDTPRRQPSPPPCSHPPSPTQPPRPRSHSRHRYSTQSRPPPTSPLRRTPTSPLPRSTPPPLTRTPTTPLSRTPTSPMARTPTSPFCREPTSPMGRSTPSPVSPRSSVSGRHFRYDVWAEQRGLRRRSSLLTVPSSYDTHSDLHLRLPRPRSSSIAGPLRPPDLARYLSDLSQRHLRVGEESERGGGGGGGSGDVSICSSFDESEHEPEATSPQYDHSARSASHDYGRSTTPTATFIRSGPTSPGHDPFSSTESPRRRNSSADPSTGVCRLRQFSITSRGGVVNRGDSFRPRRSASNTSVTSTVSSCSRERLPSVGSIPSTPGCSKVPTPTASPQHRVVMIGAPGVGKSTLITQFMTSEYMCAYDDSPGTDEGSTERSVSVSLEGEEAELVFIHLQDITQAIAREGHADGWVVLYSISDRESFKAASTGLGKVWSLGHVTNRAVILVGNKTDLERTRVVTTAEGRTLATTYECKFIEVSAGFDHNVDELLVGILTQIRLKQQAQPGGEGSAGGSFDMSPTNSVGGNSTSSPTSTNAGKLRHKNSFRVKGILNKLLNKDRKAKSCENLQVL
ncbi:GTP-binding protein REM 2-like isoform X2 [Eriocheir sinensis]|uniref:GTP-binding protein REM 2-like isoform X2 n=1 Tax=Eriocheir sinensis TaxID=95602 RepID=UPI0021C6C85A|nr:GTP-binding protein REM 2-like isoform X2 [Eriocheir sinensis]